MQGPYIERLVDPLLDELFRDLPALLLVGPRAAGKTTTAQRRARQTLRLTDRNQAAALLADPVAVLASIDDTPLLVDEWQLVPDVLAAVKLAVDNGAPPGTFLLTGSTRAEMSAVGWPATGRVVRVPLWGLTQRELAGNVSQTSIVDLLFDADIDRICAPPEPLDLRAYVDTALRSGFPEAQRLQSDRTRRAWLASYVDQLVLRDSSLAGETRDPERLRRYLRAIAANTAGVVAQKSLANAASINHSTAQSYDGLLELLHVTEQLPPWTSSRLSRIGRAPKRHLTEPALLGPLWRLDTRAVLRDGDVLGRLIESFVVAQLRPECVVAATAPAMYHVRRNDARHEIDLLLEGPAGAVVGIEVKAAAHVDRNDARHLLWLRDELGAQFAAGVVFHTGSLGFRIDERIWALPIASIWAAHR